MEKLVSVIMPAYNAGKYIAQSISSIINQTYKEWELIIVNDGSTDNTEEIVLKYVKQFPEKVFLYRNERNMGAAYTLNVAKSHAKGEYICWLSADDLYFETMIESQATFLESNSCYDACFSKHITINEDNKMLTAWNPEEFVAELKEEHTIQPYHSLLMIGNAFHGCSVLGKREIYKKTGDFNTKYIYATDYEYWMRMAAFGRIGFVDEYNVMGREYPEQTSKLGRNDIDAIRVFGDLAQREDVMCSLFQKCGMQYSREAVKNCFIYRIYIYRQRNKELKEVLSEFVKYVMLLMDGVCE